MVSLTAEGLAGQTLRPAAGPRPARRGRLRPGRTLILLVAVIYFVGPLAAALWFSIDSADGVDWHAYRDIPSAPGFVSALLLSLEIATITVLLSLVLMVPTMLLVHLRYPRARTAVEVLSLFPLVVPPVVLVVGVGKIIAWGNTTDTSTVRFQVTNQLLNSHPPFILPLLYVILALPFTFRSLDAGIRASSIQTLVEAARNLGASWPVVVWQVALPTLRASVVTAALLAFALAFGEFTVASILQYQPFTVWLLQFNNTDGQLSVALSLLSLAMTWVLLLGITALAGRTPSEPRSERKPRG
jgi:putative spermidine/putrescine transport system permease protein